MKKAIFSFFISIFLVLLLGLYFDIDYSKAGLVRSIWIFSTVLSSIIVALIVYLLDEPEIEHEHEETHQKNTAVASVDVNIKPNLITV